jgi:hypothetical protein
LRWGKAKLKGWEAEIKRRARGRVDMGQNAKNVAAGLVFCERIAGGIVFGLARPDLCA